MFFSGFAQNYYIAFKQGYSFEPIQKTVNNDSTLALQFNNNTLTNFFSNKQVYYFEKAFPTAQTEILQRVYKVKSNNSSYLNEIATLEEVEYTELTEEDEIIDVSSYQLGIYTVTLVCDGEVQSSKSLIKN